MTRRLILSYVAITTLVLILLEVPFGVFFAQRELDRLTAAVERDAAVIATAYEDYLEKDATPDPTRADTYAARTGARVVVVDDRGLSRVDTAQSTPRDFSTRPEIVSALGGNRSVGTRPSETLDTDLLFVSLPIASSGVVHGAVRLTLDTAEVDARVQRFWWGLAAIGGVVLASITLIGWLLARSVTQPIRQLNDVAHRFGRGDLAFDPSSSGGPPEIRALATSMSTMANQLSTMIEQQRAFVADASHQLRTPLTGLRLRLENLQATMDPSAAAQIELAIDETTRLSHLVDDLLQLARTERHRPPTPHDLLTIVSERVDTWGAVAESSGIRLAVDGPGTPLMVSAVPGAIEQIFDNVLDNAMRVTPVGSSIRISLGIGTDRHTLSISDEGPGLSDEDKARALRRFWRGDVTQPGTGLGLSIASELARASGGMLTLHDGPTHGLRVEVDLPVAPPA